MVDTVHLSSSNRNGEQYDVLCGLHNCAYGPGFLTQFIIYTGIPVIKNELTPPCLFLAGRAESYRGHWVRLTERLLLILNKCHW
jgi:hypothetical protein